RTPAPHYDAAYWREEREAIARLAVWQAAQAYQEQDGVSREAFAVICAKRAIYAEWRRGRERDKVVISIPVDEETGEAMEFVDEGALEALEEAVLCMEMREVLDRLSAEDRRLIEWYFGEGLSERAIAEQLGRSKTWVHNRLTGVIEQLRAWLGGNPSSEKGKRAKRGKEE
ncbi:MAG: sigma-70 family RNA polymerase sigma factor, partial [Fimbriimonadales bacterium]